MKPLRIAPLLAAACLLAACATPKSYDYSAFLAARPKSILVLPPLNEALDIKASPSLLAQSSLPLAEAGYYVFPVAVVEESFRSNGLALPGEIHAVSPAKLREIFGADAVLYLRIREYGTRYAVLSSDTTVAASAKLVDLRNGATLWEGSARASSNENRNNNDGLLVMLVRAAVEQIVNTLNDQGHQIAGITAQRLLTPRHNGMLHGPRSPHYGKDLPATR